MGVLSLSGRMFSNQEAAIKTDILRAAGKEIKLKIPRVLKSLDHFDPIIGVLKFLLILEETCNAQDRDVQDILQAAESNMK